MVDCLEDALIHEEGRIKQQTAIVGPVTQGAMPTTSAPTLTPDIGSRVPRNIKDKSQSRDMCFICNKHGHWARNCRQRAKHEKATPKHYYSFISSLSMSASPTNWTVDMAATDHFCADKMMFSTLTAISTQAHSADTMGTMDMKGKGTVRLAILMGNTTT